MFQEELHWNFLARVYKLDIQKIKHKVHISTLPHAQCREAVNPGIEKAGKTPQTARAVTGERQRASKVLCDSHAEVCK